MSRVPENKRSRGYGKRSPAHGIVSPAYGKLSPALETDSASESKEAGRFNMKHVHAFVVIAFIAVFILGLMIKITFF
jgi:hypothetical protein